MTHLLHAQCSYTPGGSCGTTITTPLTISGSTSWSGTVCVEEDVTIAGGGVLTISSGTNVAFEPGVSITVQDGGQLIIDDAELYASGGSGMWAGIIGEAGNSIEVDHSTILHAAIAIQTTGESGYTSTLIVTNSTCFGNNEIGIYMFDDPYNLTHLIEDTEISAPALVSPKSGQVGDYGILIIGPSTLASDEFQIGNSYPLTSSSTFNHIHDVAIGIRTSTANTVVQNTFIENMLNTDPGDMPSGAPIDELALFDDGNIGVLATSNYSYNLNNILTVGLTVTGGSDINNYFYQDGDAGNNAIIAFNSMSTQILSNRIEAKNVSAYLMDTAIFVRGNSSSHDMRNNIISNFTEFGILSDNITNGSTLMQNNTIARDVNPSTAETPFGIYVDAASTNQEVEIYDNTIAKVETGIFIRNHEDAIATGNIIHFDKGAGEAVGIYVQNCEDISVQANYAEGTCNTTTCAGSEVIAGYYVTNSVGMELKENYSENAVIGYLIRGTNTTGNMTCNEIHDCEFGFGLWNVVVDGIDDDLGPIERPGEEPADNSWYDATTANRETHFGATDVEELIWRYRDLDYDGTTPLPAFDMPDALIVPPPIYTPSLHPYYDFSDYSATCGYPYRSDDDSIALALLELELKFARWLNSDIAYSNSYADYIYKTYFWSKVNDTPGLNEYLEDDYAAMYETISTTNIPDFYSYQTTIQTCAYSDDIPLMDLTSENTLEDALSYILPLAASEQSFTFIDSESDSEANNILILAESDAKENGMAVFIAQALLDTIIVYPIVYETVFSVGTIAKELQFSLYPNPAYNQLLIKANFDNNEMKKLELYNSFGILVHQNIYSGKQFSLDVHDIPNGLYIIRITSGSNTVFSSHSIIIQ